METKVKMISLGKLLSDSWQEYKAKFIRLIKLQLIQALAAIPIAATIGAFAVMSVLRNTSPVTGIINIVLGLLGIVAIIFLVIFSVVVQVASLHVVKDTNSYTVKEALKKGYNSAAGYWWVAFLILALVLLWSLLLIIPGIVMAIFFSLATWVYLGENIGGYGALKRSKELIKGYWWPVFWRTIFWPLVAVIVLSIPFSFFPAKSEAERTYSIFNNIINFLIGPFSLIYSYQIYKNIVSIKNKKTETAI